jgi:hypothetical protein
MATLLKLTDALFVRKGLSNRYGVIFETDLLAYKAYAAHPTTLAHGVEWESERRAGS